MAVVIDLIHLKRARRLFTILLRRHGIRYFLLGDAEAHFRIDPHKLDEAVALCADWMSVRTGHTASDETRALLRLDLRRLLIQRVAEAMVQAGY